jgi:hypothetical protein
VSDEKESAIKRRWLNDAKLSVCARERTGKLSKKTTKEGGFNANQQGLGIGLGQIDRATLRRGVREGYFAPRSQKVGVPAVRKEETAALDEAQNGGRDG